MKATDQIRRSLPDEVGQVSVFPITQATTATFADLYFRLTFFFFIQRGEKHVETPAQGEMLGREGDLMIFPPGAMVTMVNRPVLDDAYRALGVCFSHDLIDSVFVETPMPRNAADVQVVRSDTQNPNAILSLIQENLANDDLPDVIRQHRLVEPLIWLRDQGVILPSTLEEQPISKVRRLIETDLSHPWMAKILLHTRLEHGLSLLQTTDDPISEIALDCGFKTPSHFSDAFRKRFRIKPKDIRLAAD
jgi:AraC-like DNA-binding protein